MKRQHLDLAALPALKLNKVSWILITEDNYKEVFALLKRQNKDVVLFGLTDDNYEVLSINFAQIRKYIILNNSMIERYKDYYEGSAEDVKGQ